MKTIEDYTQGGNGPLARENIPNGIISCELAQKLQNLLSRITFEEGNGDLVIQNGVSKIRLQSDGTIRIEGRRLVQVSEKDISFHAAYINLN